MDEQEIRALIAAVIDEEHQHFAKRAPATFRDENGNEWVTGALKKAEIVRFIAWCLAGVAAIVFSGLVLFAKVEIYPEVDRRIEAHQLEAEKEMSRIAPTFASTAELKELRTDLEVSRAQRIEQYASIQAQLNRIEARLDKLVR